ncbi:MAG: T9SS type A sorting domain-containing protein [Bacteroidetes bacterium]|nr:T9SS type A sorting domain-containing protein [Bacteroidota bacterium]
MKTTKQILTVFFLILTNTIYSQWTLTTGPGTPNGNTLYAIGETIYAGTNSGAYRTTNNGDNWSLLNNGITGSTPIVNDFSYDDQKLWCATTWSGLYFSTNNGDIWIQEYSQFIDASASVLASNGFTISTKGTTAANIYFSTNSGLNWIFTNILLNSPKKIEVNGSFVYVGSYNGFYWSVLGGTSWTESNGNLTGDQVKMNMIKYNSNKIYAATYNGIWSTTNTGVNWINLNLSLSNENIKTLSVLDQNIFIGTSDNMYLSTNDGTNWTSIYQGLPTSTTIRSIAYNSHYVFVMLNTGIVYRRPLSDFGIIGIQTISSEVPEKFTLSQNYPNPFNPTTHINFSVPKYGLVKITIYDINGREISTLANEEMQPGSYKVDFDGSNLSSGIYYYTLTAEEFVETKKMMLVK